MDNGSKKKSDQLGMPIGTASNRLRKIILFSLLKEMDKNYCHQCGSEIEAVDELSIEHKKPWLDSEDPVKLFFDLDNISFSHLSCNSGAARKTVELAHPSTQSYSRGCRCDSCKEIKMETRKGERERAKERDILAVSSSGQST